MTTLPEGSADALYAACVGVVAELKGTAHSAARPRGERPPLRADWCWSRVTADAQYRECISYASDDSVAALEDASDRSDALQAFAKELCTAHDDVTVLNVLVMTPAALATAERHREGRRAKAIDYLWAQVQDARRVVGPPIAERFEDLTKGEGTAPAGRALELPDLDIDALSAARFVDVEPPPQEFVGPFPHPTTGVVSGGGGSSKSTFMQAMSTGIATAVDVLGVPEWVPDAPRKVLMLSAEESTDDLHRRQHALIRGVEKLDFIDDMFGDRLERGPLLRERLHDGRFTLASTQGMRIELVDERGRRKGADWLRRQIDRGEFDLVVIDPVAAFRTGPEDALQPLIDLGREINEKHACSVVYIHHTNKASRGTDQAREAAAARGDSALLDGARFGFGVAGMTADEATRLKVDDRKLYTGVRLSKANYTAESDVLWFVRGHAGVLYATSFAPLAQRRADQRGTQRTAVLKLVAELEAKELRTSKSELVARIKDAKIATRDAARAIVEDLIGEKALRVEYGDPGDTERRSLPHGWILTGEVA
ncbi:MAG TPA: AAA family ATPase [Gammaproteobacteria bacterium]|nr:AAA family ATPase [Gammaproteobacteria bacterium]